MYYTIARMMQAPGSFDTLTPHIVTASVEAFFDLQLDGTVERYASYVNRVYGLRTQEGDHLVAKFYRPGRWSTEAILEEHQLLQELDDAEVPVVAPIADSEGNTLLEVELEPEEYGGGTGGGTGGDGQYVGDARGDGRYVGDARGDGQYVGDAREDAPLHRFALFPRRGGRSFDAESDDDWFRLGSIVARLHLVGRREAAPHRLTLDPVTWTGAYVKELLSEEIVHGDCAAEFEEIARGTIDRIAPLFQGVPVHRLHGDCHRGNILDRPGEGLLLIDFDDMMNGPAVQDLWLLLPDRAGESRRELVMLLDGYRQFATIGEGQLDLIEPLRFMRIIHFLAWRARQRHDHWFASEYPGWGDRAFWTKEIEDLRDQARFV